MNNVKLLLVPLMGLILVACKTSTSVKSNQDVIFSNGQSQTHAFSNIEIRLLEQAEYAFREGRLLPDKKNNAYDLFHSVLLINSHNSRARSGLQAILLSYSDKIRKQLAKNRLSRSAYLLNYVEPYYAGNGLLLDLRKQLTLQQQALNSQNTITPPTESDEFFLTGKPFRSEKNKKRLAEVAKRLKATDESVLITARNDAEGRWMYKQMRTAVKGYRVRGDIRMGKKPKIKILPPINL